MFNVVFRILTVSKRKVVLQFLIKREADSWHLLGILRNEETRSHDDTLVVVGSMSFGPTSFGCALPVADIDVRSVACDCRCLRMLSKVFKGALEDL